MSIEFLTENQTGSHRQGHHDRRCGLKAMRAFDEIPRGCCCYFHCCCDAGRQPQVHPESRSRYCCYRVQRCPSGYHLHHRTGSGKGSRVNPLEQPGGGCPMDLIARCRVDFAVVAVVVLAAAVAGAGSCSWHEQSEDATVWPRRWNS